MVDHYELTPEQERDVFFRAWLGVDGAAADARLLAERLYGPLRSQREGTDG